MFAAIDLGSNSFRLYISQYTNHTFHIIKTAKEPNRLALGLDQNNNLSPIAITNALQSLHQLKLILDQYPIKKVRAVATHTFRVAKNTSSILKKAEEILGVPIDIISGEEEGRLIYLGVDRLLSIPEEKRLVIDIGGGSTEIISGTGKTIETVHSCNIGTVTQSKLFFQESIISSQYFDAAVHNTRFQLKKIQSHFYEHSKTNIYGSSGTIRAIAEIIANSKIGNGDLNEKNLDVLQRKLIEIGRINQLSFSEIKKDRNASIVGGLTILKALMQELKIPKIIPIKSGLRMGVLWNLHLQK